ncbi:MAG: ISAs1 family transposase [Alteromonadaceae bacterium]|nr:ISAs1 family transposase [Alteromonadaceae bacterium]
MNFLEQIESITDTRIDTNKEYELVDIVFVTIAVLLSGANGWKALQLFGDAQLEWLRQFRPFSNGIPTRHSIGRIIRGIKSECFVACFNQWADGFRSANDKEHIAFDGKVLRGSKHGDKVNALQLMTAMVVDSGLVIYQKETDCKTNEIPVMQSMLSSMLIKGCIITADAMHCQTETAKLVREGDADYVLQVKNNQKNLLKEINAYFHKTTRDTPDLLAQRHYHELDGEHGRINERHYRILPITDWFEHTDKFKDSNSVVEVQRTRIIKDKIQQETSYYITSLQANNVKEISNVIRRHWAIENSQHWVLDVTFREDDCEIYAANGARNLASMRRVLFNLINEHPLKDSVAGKMQRACWDAKFRAEILFGQKTDKA